MGRSRLALALLAVVGWTGTIVAQCIARSTADEAERIEWTERRNLCLLVSSLATNTLALGSAYRYLRTRNRNRNPNRARGR